MAADEFTCAICLDVLALPARLGCGHVFCSKCIHKHINARQNCPLCRVRAHDAAIDEGLDSLIDFRLGETLSDADAARRREARDGWLRERCVKEELVMETKDPDFWLMCQREDTRFRGIIKKPRRKSPHPAKWWNEKRVIENLKWAMEIAPEVVTPAQTERMRVFKFVAKQLVKGKRFDEFKAELVQHV